jgi:hypothetical protein
MSIFHSLSDICIGSEETLNAFRFLRGGESVPPLALCRSSSLRLRSDRAFSFFSILSHSSCKCSFNRGMFLEGSPQWKHSKSCFSRASYWVLSSLDFFKVGDIRRLPTIYWSRSTELTELKKEDSASSQDTTSSISKKKPVFGENEL